MGFPGFGGGGGGQDAAVPVEVTVAARRDISSFIETNGTLEAENEVDIVARTSGVVVELKAEEAMLLEKDARLARLDQEPARAALEVSRVELTEAELAFARAEELSGKNLISREDHEQAKARLDAARARHQSDRIQLGYTDIRAPFAGLVVERYVKLAEHVGNGQPLFRISDFDPLLVRIQVPERELARLHVGQSAYLTVEAYPGQRFGAGVVRVSPVVDAASGTIRVTLKAETLGKLRPGMFASVYLRTDTRTGSVVIPKAALALESIGDTVYVAAGDVAERREVTLGYREGDLVEVRSGVEEGERVVSVGQDGLADGTPLQVLTTHGGDGSAPRVAARRRPDGDAGVGGERPQRPERAERAERAGRRGGGRRDFSKMTPDQLEFIKQRMRQRGMTEQQIEERMKQMRERMAEGGGAGAPGR